MHCIGIHISIYSHDCPGWRPGPGPGPYIVGAVSTYLSAKMEVEVEIEEGGFANGTPIHEIKRYGSMSPCSEVCEVCLSRPISPSCATFEECGHKFCHTCVSTAYEEYIKEGKTITCLHCSTPARPQLVKDHVTPLAYDRYLDYTLRQYLALQQPNIRQCTAPDCPFAYIVDNPSNCEDYHFVCQREGCDTEYCVKCKRAWHEGVSCKKASKQQGKKLVSFNHN